MTVISIKVEFSGGLELLFSNQRVHRVELPTIDPATSQEPNLQYLIEYLRDNLLKERVELFIENKTVCVLFEILALIFMVCIDVRVY